MPTTENIPRDKESELSLALISFERSTERLEKMCSIGNPDSALCKRAIQDANLECINYHYILDQIERNYGAIPMEQAERYISDLNRCLKVMSYFGKVDPSIYGFMQQMDVRRELVSEEFKKY